MRKLQILLVLLGAIVSLHSLVQGEKVNNLTMYVGTYAEGGNSKGTYTYNFNRENGTSELLNTTTTANPSLVTLSPKGKRLYIVGECNDGRQGAHSLDLSENRVKLSNSAFRPTASKDALPRAGANPCHIINDGSYVVTASYIRGDTSVFSLDTEGRLQTEVQHITFAGRVPECVVYIHCIIPTPDKKYISATDLGNDRVYCFRYNKRVSKKAEVPTAQQVVYQVSDGQGPHHLTFNRDGHFTYLINELGGECVVFSYRKGKLKEVQRLTADEGGGCDGADIHISPDGRFSYISHHLKKDGIAVFAINPKKGTLTKVDYQLTGVHPRNLAITPNGKYLLVACRDNSEVRTFQRNGATGELIETSQEVEVDKPTCILFAKSN